MVTLHFSDQSYKAPYHFNVRLAELFDYKCATNIATYHAHQGKSVGNTKTDKMAIKAKPKKELTESFTSKIILKESWAFIGVHRVKIKDI